MIVLQTIISKSKMGRTYRGDNKRKLIEKYVIEREKRNKKKDCLKDDKKESRRDDYEDDYRRYN